MKTQKEIRLKYKQIHDDLSERYYRQHDMTKEDFVQLHAQNWRNLRAELLEAGYIIEAVPPRDLAAEIDELNARITKAGL